MTTKTAFKPQRMTRDEVLEIQERRRSNAAGTHKNPRDRRARTRSAAVRRAVKEQTS